MNKLALMLAALALSAAPAVAKDRHVDRSPSILECGIFFTAESIGNRCWGGVTTVRLGGFKPDASQVASCLSE